MRFGQVDSLNASFGRNTAIVRLRTIREYLAHLASNASMEYKVHTPMTSSAAFSALEEPREAAIAGFLANPMTCGGSI